MKCKINCSFGEIVDKYTILTIKKSKVGEGDALTNIQNELTNIEQDCPKIKQSDELFDELKKINLSLWELEDLVREKSLNKQFDQDYIQCTESIHKTNDQRYSIKRMINNKYNSFIKEEKIYAKNVNKQVKAYYDKHVHQLEYGKLSYTNGQYIESMSSIKSLSAIFDKLIHIDQFYVDFLFSYSNICSIFNIEFPYFDKVKMVMQTIDQLELTEPFVLFCKKQYSTICLQSQQYELAFKYISIINYIIGPNISYKNQCFFKKGDKNKTLFLYDGGGLGDLIMFSRFIPRIIDQYPGNHIVFMVNERLLWFFSLLYKDVKSITLLNEKTPYLVGVYDYHCSLINCMQYLNITYHTLFLDTIYHKIKVDVSLELKPILDNIKPNTYILNWKGNPNNPHEKNNRMMQVNNAIPLFKIPSVHWIVISKDITSLERKFLKRYNISYIGRDIDKKHAFYDTCSILQKVTGVVSTDTSLPHLSLSLRVKTYVLLTLGCEWRWGRNTSTNWYPSAVLLRQKTLANWNDPIQELVRILS